MVVTGIKGSHVTDGHIKRLDEMIRIATKRYRRAIQNLHYTIEYFAERFKVSSHECSSNRFS